MEMRALSPQPSPPLLVVLVRLLVVLLPHRSHEESIHRLVLGLHLTLEHHLILEHGPNLLQMGRPTLRLLACPTL